VHGKKGVKAMLKKRKIVRDCIPAFCEGFGPQDKIDMRSEEAIDNGTFNARESWTQEWKKHELRAHKVIEKERC
jgi:hypothetical protein